MATITEKQLAHLRENQLLFDGHQIEENADIEEYFRDHDEDSPGELYLCVCADLGIDPVSSEESRTSRGFGDYATIENDLYGSKVVVRQSSLATEDAVWIFAQETDETRAVGYTNPSPHLTVDMAKEIVRGLNMWIFDVEGGLI